jgi:DNA-binding FadR family transcriptional regulator
MTEPDVARARGEHTALAGAIEAHDAPLARQIAQQHVAAETQRLLELRLRPSQR